MKENINKEDKEKIIETKKIVDIDVLQKQENIDNLIHIGAMSLAGWYKGKKVTRTQYMQALDKFKIGVKNE